MSAAAATPAALDRSRWTRLQVHVGHTRMAPKLVAALRGTPGLELSCDPDRPGPGVEVLVGYHFPPGSCAGLDRLRWVHLTGTGIEHLADVSLPPGVLVTTSASVPVAAVAEYALSGLLLLLKDLAGLAGDCHRAWFTSNARMLAGSTVGVVGPGRIGSAVLRRLAALGAVTIAVTRPGAPSVEEAAVSAGADRLVVEASRMDALIACLPAGSGTWQLIDADVLAALPERALVVNVGRAATIDTAALYAALHAGRLGGAFLDVHDVEPLPPDDPAWSVPNLVVSPHCAFSVPGEPEGVAAAFLDNLDDLRHGRSPRDRATWPLEELL